MKTTNKSYRTDETYTKVKGEDKYLYRAVDSTGQTIEFLLTAKTGRCGSQAVLPQGREVSGKSCSSTDQRGKEPGLSGGSGRAEGRAGTAVSALFRVPGGLYRVSKRCT